MNSMVPSANSSPPARTAAATPDERRPRPRRPKNRHRSRRGTHSDTLSDRPGGGGADAGDLERDDRGARPRAQRPAARRHHSHRVISEGYRIRCDGEDDDDDDEGAGVMGDDDEEGSASTGRAVVARRRSSMRRAASERVRQRGRLLDGTSSEEDSGGRCDDGGHRGEPRANGSGDECCGDELGGGGSLSDGKQGQEGGRNGNAEGTGSDLNCRKRGATAMDIEVQIHPQQPRELSNSKFNEFYSTHSSNSTEYTPSGDLVFDNTRRQRPTGAPAGDGDTKMEEGDSGQGGQPPSKGDKDKSYGRSINHTDEDSLLLEDLQLDNRRRGYSRLVSMPNLGANNARDRDSAADRNNNSNSSIMSDFIRLKVSNAQLQSELQLAQDKLNKHVAEDIDLERIQDENRALQKRNAELEEGNAFLLKLIGHLERLGKLDDVVGEEVLVGIRRAAADASSTSTNSGLDSHAAVHPGQEAQRTLQRTKLDERSQRGRQQLVSASGLVVGTIESTPPAVSMASRSMLPPSQGDNDTAQPQNQSERTSGKITDSEVPDYVGFPEGDMTDLRWSDLSHDPSAFKGGSVWKKRTSSRLCPQKGDGVSDEPRELHSPDGGGPTTAKEAPWSGSRPGSRPGSMSGSRPGSMSGSRPGSRPGSSRPGSSMPDSNYTSEWTCSRSIVYEEESDADSFALWKSNGPMRYSITESFINAGEEDKRELGSGETDHTIKI